MTVLPEKCDVDLIVLLTGVSSRRIYKMAEEGKIPQRVDGLYPTMEILKTLFSYYRGKGEGRTSLEEEKLAKMTAERERAELEVKKLKREVLPRKAVEKAWNFQLQAARAKWMQFPPKAALAFPQWVDSRACENWHEAEVKDLLTEFAASPDYDAPQDDEDELTEVQKVRASSDE